MSQRGRLFILIGCLFITTTSSTLAADNVTLNPPSSRSGYLALLLINEVPFPGEHGYRSVADSKAAMLAILWVLHSRIAHIPTGYTRSEIAMTDSRNIIDVMTVGGRKGQVDGFYRDANGQFRTEPRVRERVNYLTQVANNGTPGKFAELLNHAQQLATSYFESGPDGPDIFKDVKWIGPQPMTGRSYAWMTDHARFNPGGDYVKIPDRLRGSLGGNRFYTLKRKE